MMFLKLSKSRYMTAYTRCVQGVINNPPPVRTRTVSTGVRVQVYSPCFSADYFMRDER